jgi:hypothetical protein
MLPGWSGCIPKITRIDATGSTARASPFKLHSQCLDGRPQGYILKWLDAETTPPKQKSLGGAPDTLSIPIRAVFGDLAREEGIPMPLKRLKPPLAHCKATTSSGKPCRAKPHKGGLCFFHSDPQKAAELGRSDG